MTEQEKRADNIDQQLWALASSLLAQKPDLERFPPDRIAIPDILKTREKEILATYFDGNENPSEDWIEVFATLFPENPNNIFLWMRLGQAYKMSGNMRNAILCWERVLDIDPDRPYLLHTLGDAYGKYSTVIEEFEGEDPDEFDLNLTEEECYEKSLDCWEKAVKMKPDFYQAWMSLAVNYEYKYDWDEAVRCYEEVLKSNQNHVPGLIKYSFLLGQLGNRDRAANLINRAEELDPEYNKRMEYLSSIAFHIGQGF